MQVEANAVPLAAPTQTTANEPSLEDEKAKMKAEEEERMKTVRQPVDDLLLEEARVRVYEISVCSSDSFCASFFLF